MAKFEPTHSTFDESRLSVGSNHYNPSITNFNDGYLLSYRIQSHDEAIPDNFICRLTAELEPLQSYKVDHGTLVPRLSDIRLFWHNRQLMCSFSVKSEERWRQGVAKMSSNGHLHDFRYVSLSAVEDEKNFQFFSRGGRLYAIAFIMPEHVVVDVESGQTFQSTTCFDWPYGMPRGGTPPIPFDNQWLSCFHSSRPVKGLRSLYTTGWYTFEKDPPFRITAMSKKPFMLPSDPWTRMADKPSKTQRGKAVLFPCGLVKDRQNFLLSYGLNDVAPAYRIFKKKQINDSLSARNLLTWKKRPNFGDRLSRPIIEFLGCGERLGRTSCTSNNQGSHRLLGLGTIFHLAKRGDVVWGSGLGNHLKHNQQYVPEPDITILSVRGPKTRRLYLESGGANCPEVYGDPAILLPDYYKPKPVKSEVAILPHIDDLELKARFPTAARICSSGSNIWNVVDKIAGSKLLITSSLHGLIIAESYGVPVVLYLPSKISEREGLFKYEDYFESTGRSMNWVREGDLEEVRDLQRKVPRPIFPNKQALKKALIQYFA